MAIVKPNSIFESISGTIGDSLTFRNVGNTTILSAKPSRPRKRSRKPRSPLQLENSRKFGQAACFAKHMIKTPEVHAYFQQKAVAMGGTNNAYTALVRLHRNTPDLTEEKVLEMVRTATPEESAISEPGLTFSITGPNGDTIAQGVAVSAGKGHWTYTAPFTGVQVTIREEREG
jgi:hypothetical protein